MAFDAYLKIQGIPGEATDAKHKDWIEIDSFHWGEHQTAAAAAPGAIGRAEFQDFTITHKLDKSSPLLAQYCANGTHIPEATLIIKRAQGNHYKYMEYKLENLIISSVSPGGSASGCEPAPLEQVSLNYLKISLIYTDSKGTETKSEPIGPQQQA